MAKFASSVKIAGPTSPFQTTTPTRTHEGGRAFRRDAKSDLFVMAATNMVGEDTFYEAAGDRDRRFLDLVQAVTLQDPEWIAGSDTRKGFARYLRGDLLMRSASVVLAAEYLASKGPNPRKVISSVLQRPDEPAEMLAYWMSKYGRNLPMPLKRGVADAVVRMYNERAALRWDSQSHGLRMGDVIELVHPSPKDTRQAQLFRYLLDRGHKRDDPKIGFELEMIQMERKLQSVPPEDRRKVLRVEPSLLTKAGFSWERMAGWLPGGMDAEAWTWAIPQMGVMALVRNLRNFDLAKISEHAIDTVIARISDPEEVAKARLFPYQVWSAYKNAPSDNWRRALGKTMDLTVQNIPELDRTLVVIDTSASMNQTVSGKSTISRIEVAAVMAMATAKRSKNVDVVIFGNSHANINSQIAGMSVLGGVEFVNRAVGAVGHGTYGHTAILSHFDARRHDRVVMFTDDQQHDSGLDVSRVPTIYTFNLAGYAPQSLESGRGRYTMAGFSDATFTLMEVLEQQKNASWPF